MRGRYPAAFALLLAPVLLNVGAVAAGASAQIFGPPEPAPPAEAGAPPQAPPPTVLLPPSASDTPASELPPPKPKEPPKPVRRVAAIIQALDKTTAETLRFEAPIGQPVRYKDLVVTVHVCEDAPPGQGHRGPSAHMQIDSQPRPIPGRATPPTRTLFKGWMFADSPGLHPFEHPVYDTWLLGCKAG
jgi:hypothetical protein